MSFTITTGGNFGMYGSSVLNMLHTLDRLQIGGNFETLSTMNHSTVLRNGRIGIGGNFRQGDSECSFACLEDVMIAFTGSYTHYYWFAVGRDYFEDTFSGNDA